MELSSSPPDGSVEELEDAYHDMSRNKPYPKSDNGLFLNPPPFIVPKSLVTEKMTQFELSRDSTFPQGNTTRSEAKPWNMFGPHRKLENGKWYWRFRGTSGTGTTGSWSTTYSFNMTDDVPVFVTPPFETFSQNAPHTYPRLFCYLDPYINEARKKAASHREYKSLLSRAENAMKADYSKSDPNKDSEQLKVHIQSLYHAYHLTQNEAYADRMQALLKMMLANPVDDGLLFSANFTTTNIAVCYAMIYDILYDRLSSSERLGAENIMLRMLRKLTPQMQHTQENTLTHNHFWQQNLRVYFQSAFLLYDRPEYSAEIRPMLEYYYELWALRAPATGFNRDGAWHNGSGYYTANMTTLHYMPMLLSYVTKSDFLAHPWYKNAGKALVYTWPPHSKSTGFGDSSEKNDEPTRQYAAFADFLARELNDPYAGWYAGECDTNLQQDIELRLYRMCKPGSYNTAKPSNLQKMMWYHDIGEVDMHTQLGNPYDNKTLAFRSSTFGAGSHTTASQNAFNLLYKGKYVYHSSGYYYQYASAHCIMSYRHTRAHNTLLVNGIGQTFSTHGYGNISRGMEGEHITYCLGDASKAYNDTTKEAAWLANFKNIGINQTPEYGFGKTPLTKYRRHALMLHPEGIVILFDDLEASTPVTFDWLLHADQQMHINQEMMTISHHNAQAGFTAVTHLFCNDPLRLTVTNKFYEPTDNPALYPNQWHVNGQVSNRNRTRILAVLQVNPDGTSPLAVKQSGNTIIIGNWIIKPQLDATLPVALTISNTSIPALFSLGNEHPLINGVSYQRKNAGSSILYDKNRETGVYETTETTDILPKSTRTSY